MDPWSSDETHSDANITTPAPSATSTATVERVPLPALPPPVRARRLAPGTPPPPPKGGPVTHRRSPQASANPTQLLGPVGVVTTASSSAKKALIVVAIFAILGFVVSAVLVGRAFENTTFVNNLHRGDCVEDFFQQGADGEYVEVFLVQTAPCSQPHALEVYAVTDLLWSQDDYPGVEESFAEGQDWCFQQYDSFVGGDYATSSYDVWTFVPIAGSWADGDRTVQCLVGHYDEITLTTGSLEGIDR